MFDETGANNQDHSATFVDSFIAGAISGAIATVVTMPFDVGKTRTQVFRSSGSSVSAIWTRFWTFTAFRLGSDPTANVIVRL